MKQTSPEQACTISSRNTFNRYRKQSRKNRQSDLLYIGTMSRKSITSVHNRKRKPNLKRKDGRPYKQEG